MEKSRLKFTIKIYAARTYVYIFSGWDGWQGDWAKVYTDESCYQCQFHEDLDDNSSETGSDCTECLDML